MYDIGSTFELYDLPKFHHRLNLFVWYHRNSLDHHSYRIPKVATMLINNWSVSQDILRYPDSGSFNPNHYSRELDHPSRIPIGLFSTMDPG